MGAFVRPDTTSDVSHSRVVQPEGSKRRSAVSNSAARVVKTTTSGTLEPSKCVDAAIPTRSCRPASARGTRRSPVGSTAPAQKSERTSPHEGSHIRSTGSWRKALRKKGKRRRGATVMDQGRDKRGGQTVDTDIRRSWDYGTPIYARTRFSTATTVNPRSAE